jgi:adenylate cyclase
MQAVKGPGADPKYYGVVIEPTERRLRVMYNGEVIADSTNAQLMFETRHRPIYYFPIVDVRMNLLESTDHATT